LPGPDTRTVAAILPALDEQGWWDEELPTASSESSDQLSYDEAGMAHHRSGALSDGDREATARASYQGLMELDAELRVRSINESYARRADSTEP
jgi:hypothetical protein